MAMKLSNNKTVLLTAMEKNRIGKVRVEKLSTAAAAEGEADFARHR